MSLPGGISQNFGTFNFGDPYSLRAFSDTVHDLIQNEFAANGELFPAPDRLNATLREAIGEQLLGRASLVVDESEFTKRLALVVPGQQKPLSFLSWSAGQREFTPMLMGLYWLCTATQKRRSGSSAKETVDWVVIEEPEMGLHPKGIQAVLLLVLELLRRGYRVVVSDYQRGQSMTRKAKGKSEQVKRASQFKNAAAAAGIETRAGKAAIKAEYRAAVSIASPWRHTESVDLDAHFEKSEPNASRWDYGIGVAHGDTRGNKEARTLAMAGIDFPARQLKLP